MQFGFDRFGACNVDETKRLGLVNILMRIGWSYWQLTLVK